MIASGGEQAPRLSPASALIIREVSQMKDVIGLGCDRLGIDVLVGFGWCSRPAQWL